MVTCGMDKTVKLWRVKPEEIEEEEEEQEDATAGITVALRF